ncbi:MAG TPA: hypothetical protein EYN73_04635 [Chromatiaceae bacterium]|nr:hypothetical protein [Chromatiaceae bacterium]HIN82446.1 hypothetical protein [Chromatiales bacterium]HIO15063.1 hypothetical protein [Chromatiales bacterium]
MRQAAYIKGVISAAIRKLHKAHVSDSVVENYSVSVNPVHRVDIQAPDNPQLNILDDRLHLYCSLVAVGRASIEAHHAGDPDALALAKEFTRLEGICLHGQRSDGAQRGHQRTQDAREEARGLALKYFASHPDAGIMKTARVVAFELERLDFRNRSNGFFQESTVRNWIRPLFNQAPPRRPTKKSSTD